jgi:ABC-type dipeptide/oligopeptide/nickel transport system permease component
MLNYILRRLLTALPVLWAAATITFFAVHLAPGDPATAQLAQSGTSAAAIAERRAALGLDDPLDVQYVRYLGGLLKGDLGRSWNNNQPVSQIIVGALFPTLILALAATGFALGIGLTLGTIAALARHPPNSLVAAQSSDIEETENHYRYTWLDTLCMSLALSGLSTPVALSGLLAILVFSLGLGWLPATGQGSWRHLLLPAMVLGWANAGTLSRLTRDRLLDVLDQPYIVAARARGVSTMRLIRRHAARVALPDILTMLALQVGFLLGGTVVTESVFARRGLGRVAVEAVIAQDLPVAQGIVLLAALTYTLSNLAADLFQMWLDPRLREVTEWN